MKKFLKIPYYALIVAIILIGVFLAAALLPIPGNYQVKIVQSGSMEPSIDIGSIVIIRPADKYREGEVITFKEKKEEPVTHRIVGVQVIEGEVHFTTKGDANNTPDSQEVPKSEVIGKVLFDVPYLGYLIDFIKKPFGFLVVLVIPALIIVGDELRKIREEVRKMKKNKKGE